MFATLQARLRDGSYVTFQDLIAYSDSIKKHSKSMDWVCFFDLAEKSHDDSYKIKNNSMGQSFSKLVVFGIINREGEIIDRVFKQVLRNSTMKVEAPDLGYKLIDPNFSHRPIETHRNIAKWRPHRSRG